MELVVTVRDSTLSLWLSLEAARLQLIFPDIRFRFPPSFPPATHTMSELNAAHAKIESMRRTQLEREEKAQKEEEDQRLAEDEERQMESEFERLMLQGK